MDKVVLPGRRNVCNRLLVSKQNPAVGAKVSRTNSSCRAKWTIKSFGPEVDDEDLYARKEAQPVTKTAMIVDSADVSRFADATASEGERGRAELAVILTGTFMALLDITIVNVALPSIQR